MGGLLGFSATEPIPYRGSISQEDIDSKSLISGIYSQPNNSVNSGGTILYHGVLVVLSVAGVNGPYGIHIYMSGDSRNKLMRVLEYGNLSDWIIF